MDILEVFQEMVSTGQPPNEGCSIIGVGYEDAFSRLERTYLQNFFQKGKSAEKFIIGPYGSGKTHFLRQLLEVGRKNDCAVAEVPLSMNIDITKLLVVYKEVARVITLPDQKRRGIEALIKTSLNRISSKYDDPDTVSDFIESWIDGLEENDFEHDGFRRVLTRTLRSMLKGEQEIFDAGCQWLAGEVTDKNIAKILNVNQIPAAEQDGFGRRAMFSLCQFIKAAGYTGTIIGFDEAEQATNVPLKQRKRIQSMTRSELDIITKIKDASLLVVYAFTPDVIDEMRNYPALQQRVAEPDPTRRFFDGNDYSPRIDLDQLIQHTEGGSIEILQKIGERLVNLLYDQYGNKLPIEKDQIITLCNDWANDIEIRNASIGNRRDMVKLTCSRLLHLYNHGTVEGAPDIQPSSNPGDEEV